MKIRVTVEGRTYEVEVDVVDDITLASAASRVESAPMTSPPQRPNGSSGGNHAAGRSSPAPTAAPPPVPASKPTPAKPPAAKPATTPPAPAQRPAPMELPPEPSPIAGPPPPPWHGLGVGREGETVAPIAGVVTDVLVKVGDSVNLSDALLRIQATGTMGASARPLIGTLRAVAAGTVRDVLAQKGDAVAPGQVLIRIG